MLLKFSETFHHRLEMIANGNYVTFIGGEPRKWGSSEFAYPGSECKAG